MKGFLPVDCPVDLFHLRLLRRVLASVGDAQLISPDLTER